MNGTIEKARMLIFTNLLFNHRPHDDIAGRIHGRDLKRGFRARYILGRILHFVMNKLRNSEKKHAAD
jgi:hypothetical protein